MTLPLKTGILKYAIDKKNGFSVEDIMRDLDKDYHGEKKFNKSVVETYIFAFCSVQMFEEEEVSLDDKGELYVTYRITDVGMQNEKYIAKN